MLHTPAYSFHRFAIFLNIGSKFKKLILGVALLGFYDIFLKNSHSVTIQGVMRKYSYNMLEYILKKYNSSQKKNIKILEIGVGKGYFSDAVKDFNQQSGNVNIDYYAFDRNDRMLDNLQIDSNKCYCGSCPNLEELPDIKFDIVYSAFLIEHLNNGSEVYTLIREINKRLNKGGIIAFLAPDAMVQKVEFFNIDYTHIYPTTKRNVSMAFYDDGFEKVDIVPINGIMYYKNFHNKLIYCLHRFFVFFYSYKFFNLLAKPFYHRTLWDLNNFFYRTYCFIKEENLLFIANKH